MFLERLVINLKLSKFIIKKLIVLNRVINKNMNMINNY